MNVVQHHLRQSRYAPDTLPGLKQCQASRKLKETAVWSDVDAARAMTSWQYCNINRSLVVFDNCLDFAPLLTASSQSFRSSLVPVLDQLLADSIPHSSKRLKAPAPAHIPTITSSWPQKAYSKAIRSRSFAYRTTD